MKGNLFLGWSGHGRRRCFSGINVSGIHDPRTEIFGWGHSENELSQPNAIRKFSRTMEEHGLDLAHSLTNLRY